MSALPDPTRRQIVQNLRNGGLSVGELTGQLPGLRDCNGYRGGIAGLSRPVVGSCACFLRGSDAAAGKTTSGVVPPIEKPVIIPMTPENMFRLFTENSDTRQPATSAGDIELERGDGGRVIRIQPDRGSSGLGQITRWAWEKPFGSTGTRTGPSTELPACRSHLLRPMSVLWSDWSKMTLTCSWRSPPNGRQPKRPGMVTGPKPPPQTARSLLCKTAGQRVGQRPQKRQIVVRSKLNLDAQWVQL